MAKKVGLWITAGMVIVACLCGWAFMSADGNDYYTQIDNSHITENGPRDGVIDLDGGMAYTYTLTSYDEKGNAKVIDFGTSRKLREGAFIRLNVVAVRGVTSWEEVTYAEMPVAVQAHFVGEQE